MWEALVFVAQILAL